MLSELPRIPKRRVARGRRALAAVPVQEALAEVKASVIALDDRRAARVPTGRGRQRIRCTRCYAFKGSQNQVCKCCGFSPYSGHGS